MYKIMYKDTSNLLNLLHWKSTHNPQEKQYAFSEYKRETIDIT